MNEPRSQFVTVLASVLLVLNGFGLLMALLQNLMIGVMVPQLGRMVPEASEVETLLTGLFRTLGAVILVIAAFHTWASWALLKRRNWARRLFIVEFALGIVSTGLGILMAATGLAFVPTATMPLTDPDLQTSALQIFRAMVGVFAVVGIALCVLYCVAHQAASLAGDQGGVRRARRVVKASLIVVAILLMVVTLVLRRQHAQSPAIPEAIAVQTSVAVGNAESLERGAVSETSAHREDDAVASAPPPPAAPLNDIGWLLVAFQPGSSPMLNDWLASMGERIKGAHERLALMPDDPQLGATHGAGAARLSPCASDSKL